MELKTKKRVTVALSITLIVISLSLIVNQFPPEAEAAYGTRKRTDSWGDKIQINSNYNIGGGAIDFIATSGKNGFKITIFGVGFDLGSYIARIRKFYISVKCYDANGNVLKSYRRTYYPNRATYRRGVSVPAGTVRVRSYMSVRFQLLIIRFGLPTRTLSVSLYS